MKKVIAVALCLIAGMARAQTDPRGDLYSARAIQALEQCFDSSGNFTCDASAIREDFDAITLHLRAQTYGTFDAGTNGQDIPIMPGSRVDAPGYKIGHVALR